MNKVVELMPCMLPCPSCCFLLDAVTGQANVLYSGSDDSTFKGWDVRCPAAVSSSSSDSTSTAGNSSPQAAAETGASPLLANRRAHGAGVCCISSHPRREHVLVTGSYDETVRLWDVRMLQRPVETCQVGCAGWHVQDSEHERDQAM